MGNQRHWFSIRGQAYLRSPVCVRCGAPNPRRLDDHDLGELEAFNRNHPGYVGIHVVTALRALGRAG